MKKELTISSDSLWLIISLLLAFAGYCSNNITIDFVILLFIYWVELFRKRSNPEMLYLMTSIFINPSMPALLYIIAIMPVFINKNILNFKATSKDILFIVLFISFISLSIFCGIIPNVKTAFLFFLNFILLLSLSKKQIDFDLLDKYCIYIFIGVLLILLSNYFNGGFQIKYGRLAINDNIRELANTISIPFFISFMSIFSNKNKKKLSKIIILTVSSILLLATLSRGAIIACIVGIVSCYIVNNKKGFKNIWLIVLMLLLLLIGYMLLEKYNIFRLNRLFEKSYDLNGRTDIWNSYWLAMKDNTRRLLFGFGPGDVRRLDIINTYSHSIFFDVLFSYGIYGFIIFIIYIMNVAKKIIKSHDFLSIGLFVFACSLYLTHGVCTTISFYILISISIAINNKNKVDEV